ncbi:unnamed protein product [Lactuca virosa]|uniref:Transposase (putative) gypsy type domain-containing protein n=1 Tax=Lactuca virosa TaxID=75947 RepID=A0AAU9LP68_9ASTR|nr:unnamed protein product [Lactuca virosa]
MKSKLSPKNLSDIMKKYHIDPDFNLHFPKPGDAIVDTPEVLDYYHLHITQITPNGFQKIICFVMLCSSVDVTPSITLFHHLYITMSNDDWVSFSLCHGPVEICNGIPTSTNY